MFIFFFFNSFTVRMEILSRSLAIGRMKLFLDLGLNIIRGTIVARDVI